MQTAKFSINLQVPEDEYRRITEAAKDAGMPRSKYIRECLYKSGIDRPTVHRLSGEPVYKG